MRATRPTAMGVSKAMLLAAVMLALAATQASARLLVDQSAGAARSLLITPSHLKAKSAPSVASTDNHAGPQNNYFGLGKTGFEEVAQELTSGGSTLAPGPAVQAFEKTLTPTQLKVVEDLINKHSSSSSSSETTTTAGAKEPLKTFESDHVMNTPSGPVGLDPQEYQAYQQTMQQKASSDTSTTTSSGQVIPQSVFEKFHNGMTAQAYAAQVAQQKQQNAANAAAVAAQIAAEPAAAPKSSSSPPSSSETSTTESTTSTTTTNGGKENLWLFEAQHQIAFGGPDGEGTYGANPKEWQAEMDYLQTRWAKMYNYDYQQAKQERQQGMPTTTSSETTTTSSNGQQVQVTMPIFEQFHQGLDAQQYAQQQAQVQNADQQDMNQVQQQLANPPTSSTEGTETTTTSGQVEPLKLFEAEHQFWSPAATEGVPLDPKEYQAYLAWEASEQNREQDYIQKYQDYLAQKRQNTIQNGGKVTSTSTTTSTESTTTGGKTIEVPDYVYKMFHDGETTQQVQQDYQKLQQAEQQDSQQVQQQLANQPAPAPKSARAPKSAPSPSSSPSSSSTETTTSSGQVEPLKLFEAEHEFYTPVGEFPLDPAQYKAYEDYQNTKQQKEADYAQKVEDYTKTNEAAAGVTTSSSETTTTSGDVIPTHLFRKYHQGFDVAGWQEHQKVVAEDIKDYETDYVNTKTAYDQNYGGSRGGDR